MSNNPREPEKLRALGERLDDMRRREAAKDRRAPPSAAGIAYRFMSELVVAMVAGGAIGWALDWALGTKPILLIVFVVLGAGAGVSNVVREARKINEATAYDAPSASGDNEEH